MFSGGGLSNVRIPLFLSLLALSSCSQRQTSNSPADTSKEVRTVELAEGNITEITCWGVGEIELGDDFKAIEDKVSKQNISQDSMFVEGDFQGIFTTLWKGQDKEIEIHWKEKKVPFKTIDYLEINRSDSPYQFTNGIKIGTSLKDIEKLNGQPLNLYGFGWDYGGTFIDFGQGRLQGDIPCFGGVFSIDDTAYDMAKDIIGDKKVSSDNAVFNKTEARLIKIRISN